MDTKTELLEAANRVILREGAINLTLEAVAREAGISKGGLLYHFASKRALLNAMLERQFAPFDRAVRAEVNATPGSFTRAFIKHSSASITSAQTEAALLAAVAVMPETLEPVRHQYQEWQSLLEQDGIDPAMATLARLCMDGLYMAEIFELAPPRPELRETIVKKPLALLEVTP